MDNATDTVAQSKPNNSPFSQRELALIKNCVRYTDGNPAGLPGHNLMIIIAKLAAQIEEMKGRNE